MKPSVFIDEQVYQKIMHWVNKSDFEVSGLGMVKYENGIFRVIDAILLKQENTSSTTDIDAAAIGKAMFEMKDAEGELKFWWHSHVNMNVFWSGTDINTIKELGANGWFLSTVFNKKEEMRSCIYMTKPIMAFVDELETDVPTSITDDFLRDVLKVNKLTLKGDNVKAFRELVDIRAADELIAEWDKEYADKVTEKSYTSIYSGGTWDKYSGNKGSETKGRGLYKGGDYGDDYHGYGGYSSGYYGGYGRHTGGYEGWQAEREKERAKEQALEEPKKEPFPDFKPNKYRDSDKDLQELLDACRADTELKPIITDKVEEALRDIVELNLMHPLSQDDVIEMYKDEFPDVNKFVKYIKLG